MPPKPDGHALGDTVRHVHPPGFARIPHLTQVVTAGRLVACSGQVALDVNGAVVGGDDLGAQAERTFENLGRALGAVGGSLDSVIKLTLYVVDFQAQDLTTIARALQSTFSADRMPANTLVGVQALARPNLRVEVDAWAVVPDLEGEVAE
ncbi:RidA family protein [Rubrivirga sp.]|uniref:RidA family protein n=1 Tax=Rubrivirga sp. TaxID=1885344 RepID=UPI003C716560